MPHKLHFFSTLLKKQIKSKNRKLLKKQRRKYWKLYIKKLTSSVVKYIIFKFKNFNTRFLSYMVCLKVYHLYKFTQTLYLYESTPKYVCNMLDIHSYKLTECLEYLHYLYLKLKTKKIKIYYNIIKFKKLQNLNTKYSTTKLNMHFSLNQRIFPNLKIYKIFLRYFYITNKYIKLNLYLNLLNKFNKWQYTLQNKTPITNLYTTIKNKISNNIYFFDGNKSPLVAMTSARRVHGYYTSRRTLRNVAYKKYLLKSLQYFKNNYKQHYTLSYLLILYKIAVNWYHSDQIIKTGFIIVNNARIFINKNVEKQDIIQIPQVNNFFNFQKLMYLNFLKIEKKIKKANYISFLISKKLWMLKKKNKLRYINWYNNHLIKYHRLLVNDFITNTICLLDNIDLHYFKCSYSSFKYSSLIRLYKWKFRAT